MFTSVNLFSDYYTDATNQYPTKFNGRLVAVQFQPLKISISNCPYV
jgi:hypothetical protein